MISRRYHTHWAQVHIDPATRVQPVNGVIFILFSFPFLASVSSRFPAVYHFPPSHPLTPSLFVLFPTPVSLNASGPSFPPSHLSIHTHGSNSLSGLSHSLQASRQSRETLKQKTSFKQHYIGLAWNMSHTDRWKRTLQTLSLCGHDETQAGLSWRILSENAM